MERHTVANTPGTNLTIQAGGATVGAANKAGGDLILASGLGTGTNGSGNLRLQTSGGSSTPGTNDNSYVDRRIIVGKAKAMTLASPGFTALFSIKLTGTEVAGGKVHYTIRATDGGSQIATETGTLLYVATANSIT